MPQRVLVLIELEFTEAKHDKCGAGLGLKRGHFTEGCGSRSKFVAIVVQGSEIEPTFCPAGPKRDGLLVKRHRFLEAFGFAGGGGAPREIVEAGTRGLGCSGKDQNKDDEECMDRMQDGERRPGWSTSCGEVFHEFSLKQMLPAGSPQAAKVRAGAHSQECALREVRS